MGWGHRAVYLGTNRVFLGRSAGFVGRTYGFRRRPLTSRRGWIRLVAVRVAEARRSTEGKPQGGPEVEPKEGRKADRRNGRGHRKVHQVGAELGTRTMEARVAGRWLPWSPPLRAPGRGCPTRPRPQVAAGHRGGGPEELDGYGRTVTRGPLASGPYAGWAREARWTSSIPHGSPISSTHRSHSSSKVVCAMSKGPTTSALTRPPTA